MCIFWLWLNPSQSTFVSDFEPSTTPNKGTNRQEIDKEIGKMENKEKHLGRKMGRAYGRKQGRTYGRKQMGKTWKSQDPETTATCIVDLKDVWNAECLQSQESDGNAECFTSECFTQGKNQSTFWSITEWQSSLHNLQHQCSRLLVIAHVFSRFSTYLVSLRIPFRDLLIPYASYSLKLTLSKSHNLVTFGLLAGPFGVPIIQPNPKCCLVQ